MPEQPIKTPGDIRVRVLVLYQGDNADSHVTELTAYLASINVDGRQTKFNRRTLRKDVLSYFQNEVQSADAAIALVTHDPRPASSAGNIWFEVGYWLANKDPDRILVCLHKDATPKDSTQSDDLPVIDIISDLNGRTYAKFSNDLDLKNKVQEFISDVRNGMFTKVGEMHDADGRYLRQHKIRDTIGDNQQAWFANDASHCHVGGHPCEFRQAGLEFTSELLRMGRFNREMSAVQTMLVRFADLAERALNADKYAGDEKGQQTHRITKLTELGAAILCGKKQLEDLLRPTPTRYWDKGKIPAGLDMSNVWDRLVLFLQHRLAWAYERKLPVPNAFEIRGCSRAADSLCDDLQNYSVLLDRSYFPKTGDIGDTFAERLQQWVLYIPIFSQVLDALSSRQYQSCSQVMDREFRQVHTPTHVHQSMKSTIASLPQNTPLEQGKPTERIVDIWPAPRRLS